MANKDALYEQVDTTTSFYHFEKEILHKRENVLAFFCVYMCVKGTMKVVHNCGSIYANISHLHFGKNNGNVLFCALGRATM